MSDSNRRRQFKTGLIAVGIFAILVGLLTGLWAGIEDFNAGQNAEYQAARYADEARIDIQSKCRIAKLPSTICDEEAERRTRPEQRNEYDLQAQKTMSAWTRAMGIATVIGMAVGIFGLGLVYATFRETKRQADIALNAVNQQMKAWVSIEHMKVVHLHKLRDGRVNCKWSAKLKNYGNNVAINCRVEVVIMTMTENIPFSGWFLKFIDIMPSATEEYGFDSQCDPPNSDAAKWPLMLCAKVTYMTLGREYYFTSQWRIGEIDNVAGIQSFIAITHGDVSHLEKSVVLQSMLSGTEQECPANDDSRHQQR